MSRNFALIIGNAEYADSQSFTRLKYAAHDADAVFRLLTDSPSAMFDQAGSVCHKNLRWEQLPAALTDFFQPITPEDLVLVYFAGHGEKLGDNRLALIMQNTDRANLAGTAFNVERLVDYLTEKKLPRYIIMLDCCRAGKALKSPGVISRGGSTAARLDALSGIGRIFVAAAAEHQLAAESDALQHSLFAHYFIEGIETGKAGQELKAVIDIFEACAYIQTQIARNHADQFQEIVISGENLLGDLPIAHNPRFKVSAKPVVDIAGLPATDAILFGRNSELEKLDGAWREPDTSLAVLVAWGGVGKTALVNQWLKLMKRDHYRGAKQVYGISFYSQGAAEGKQASAEPFIMQALRRFMSNSAVAWAGVKRKPCPLERLVRQSQLLPLSPPGSARRVELSSARLLAWVGGVTSLVPEVSGHGTQS